MADFGKLKKIAGQADEAPGALDKLSSALATPQKIAAQKGAEYLGLKPEANSEANFRNIVELGAKKLGLGDSTPANIAKALAVAGLEVFGDPLGAVPVGKIVKGAKALKPVLGMTEGASKLAKEVTQAAAQAETRAQQLDKLAKLVKNKDMQYITKESSQATPTYQKLSKAKAEQEARQVAANPPRQRSEMETKIDQNMYQKFFDNALMRGLSPQEAEVSARLATKARGRMKP